MMQKKPVPSMHATAIAMPQGEGEGDMPATISPDSAGADMAIIERIMEAYADAGGGDTAPAMRRALPLILARMGAVRGAVFLRRGAGGGLACVASTDNGEGADCNGLALSCFDCGEAVVSRAPHPQGREGQGRVSIASPISLGNGCFGVIAAGWEAGQDGMGDAGCRSGMLAWQARVLALALAGLQRIDRIVRERLVHRDMDETNALRAALLPVLDPGGHIAARILSPGRIRGDFFDYIHVGGRLFFCQGDIAGATGGAAGVVAGLLMARVLAIFRSTARDGRMAAGIVRAAHDTLSDIAPGCNAGFAAGWFDPASGEAEVINCGHNLLLLADESRAGRQQITAIAPHRGGLGALCQESPCRSWQGNLGKAALYMAGGGLTTAHAAAAPRRGVAGVMRAVHCHHGLTAAARVSDIMRRFPGGVLTTGSDAAILVVSGIGRGKAP